MATFARSRSACPIAFAALLIVLAARTAAAQLAAPRGGRGRGSKDRETRLARERLVKNGSGPVEHLPVMPPDERPSSPPLTGFAEDPAPPRPLPSMAISSRELARMGFLAGVVVALAVLFVQQMALQMGAPFGWWYWVDRAAVLVWPLQLLRTIDGGRLLSTSIAVVANGGLYAAAVVGIRRWKERRASRVTTAG
jgi:hypothetical protein